VSRFDAKKKKAGERARLPRRVFRSALVSRRQAVLAASSGSARAIGIGGRTAAIQPLYDSNCPTHSGADNDSEPNRMIGDETCEPGAAAFDDRSIRGIGYVLIRRDDGDIRRGVRVTNPRHLPTANHYALSTQVAELHRPFEYDKARDRILIREIKVRAHDTRDACRSAYLKAPAGFGDVHDFRANFTISDVDLRLLLRRVVFDDGQTGVGADIQNGAVIELDARTSHISRGDDISPKHRSRCFRVCGLPAANEFNLGQN